jgi:hypothetical protein
VASKKIRTGDVVVHGLPELSRALKAIGPEAQRELRDSSKDVARFVATDAAGMARALGSTAARVAGTIRPVGGVSGAGVSFGGAANPEAGGAEFGSNRFKQFKPWRGSGSGAGYFLYPTIRRDMDRVVEEFTEAVDRIIKKRF